MRRSVIAVLTAGILAAGVLNSGFSVCAEEAEGTNYRVIYNLNNENIEDMPEFQFVCADMKGLTSYDSRMYVQIDLTLDGDRYKLVSDCYCIESGKRAEVGDDTGIGFTMVTTAEGSYTDNGDDTITIDIPDHIHHDLLTDTYSVQMKEAAGMNILGETADGEYDSDDMPELTYMVPETVFTINEDNEIVTYNYLHPEDYEIEEKTESQDVAIAAEGKELLVIPSDDEQTSFTLLDNGTYEFYFASYDIKDNGTYTYDADAASLVVTDANGKETVSEADGDSIKFHYEYSESAQLFGEFTVKAETLTDALK